MRLSPKPPDSKGISTKRSSTRRGSPVVYKEQIPLCTAHLYRPWARRVELRVYGPQATIGGKGKSEKFLLKVISTALKLPLRPPRDIRGVAGRKKVGAGGKWKRQKAVEKGGQRVLSSGWATVRSTTLPPHGLLLYPMPTQQPHGGSCGDEPRIPKAASAGLAPSFATTCGRTRSRSQALSTLAHIL